MISVGLPNYNSEIAWLAMESLCRQKTNVKWELIVYEDAHIRLGGKEFYEGYFYRLKKAGCTRIVYLYESERVLLSLKWVEMAKYAHKNSIGLILQASDCYSEPNRIQKAYDAFKKGYNWVQSNQGYFYNFITKSFMYYEWDRITGLDMAIRMRELKQIPPERKRSGIDGWLFRNIKNPKVWIDESDDWKKSLDTDGFNKISIGRRNLYDNPEPPFYKCKVELSDILPPELVEVL